MSAERVFTIEDQRLFASLSGDRNPMHVDPLYARRLLLGKTVVHGIHSLLWGLDLALANRPPLEIHSIEAKFMKPIGIDTTVRANWTWQDDDLKLDIYSEHELIVFTKASFRANTSNGRKPHPELPPVEECNKLSRHAMEMDLSEELPLYLYPSLGKQLFPQLVSTLPADQIAGMLLSSKIVGMRCPGLHSIFSGLKLYKPESSVSTEHASFSLQGFDDRFSFATISLNTPALVGTLTTFHRPKPVVQPSYDFMKSLVKNNEFSHINGLVIGGSRGIGEVTAKLLAAGGANVRLTYFMGEKDAATLANEISKGGGECTHHALDINTPSSGMKSILADGWQPSDIYYYPTPSIFKGRKGYFSSRLYESFSRYYVTNFVSLLDIIGFDQTPLRVLYPSTVAVEELQPNMAEYASAKAAGENICANLSAQFDGLNITTPRFPRLNTDQTASLYPVKNKEPTPIILDILRQMTNTDLPYRKR
jgi:hypothetical protein